MSEHGADRMPRHLRFGPSREQHACVDGPAYARSMTLTAAEVFATARTLPREERAELTQELLATLDESDVSESVRLDALRTAVAKGIASLDAGEGVQIPQGDLREYLRERGRLATERVAAKSA